jgi:hypothetical protein
VTLQEERRLNARGYSARDEQRLLDALGRGLLKEFPNPERSGCPGADVLKRIASRTMQLDQAEKLLDHLGSCSPCYSDFSEFRKSHELRKKRTLLAIAASILVVAGIAGWVLLQRHNETLVAQTAVLDLRNRSLPRGTEANPLEPPLVVSRAAAHWNIFLPFGSNDGPYDIRLLAGSGELLVSTKADAKLTEGVAAIQISVDLSSRSPGPCVLRLTRNGSQESSYVVELR